MKRILMVLAVAALMVAMMVSTAMPAFADKGGGGHCEQLQPHLEDCFGGGSEPGGGGGGGFTQTATDREGNVVETITTGGGSNFRGTGSGGGGKFCQTTLGVDQGCNTGKTAPHPPS
jgi:hypothetical protein